MALKHILSLILLVSTMMPLVVFWAWPHSSVLQGEYDEVHERHLLLARNLGAALERYHRDLVSAFEYVTQELSDHGEFADSQLLANLDFRHICLFAMNDRKLRAGSSLNGKHCATLLPEERYRLLSDLVNGDRVATSEVMADSDGTNVMRLVKAVGDQIAVGTFSTRYINQLGKNIAFGVMGHAAIVDHVGNVLSHPLDSWIAERKNIAGVSSVRRMLAGETGVETFYSPALKGDMIAGLTAVQPVGWGVMVPQPVVELHAKAEQASRSALLIMALGFLASAVIGLAAAFWIARPIEALSDASRQVASGRYVTPRLRRWLPAELASLQGSFTSMIGKLRLSLMEVNRLAYTDGVTGLANRTYFLRRAVNVIDHSKREGRTCSLLFIDLDGFKPVNDNLGHDMGDIVLKSVADRLADHFRVLPVGDLIDQNPLECDIASDEVIVARLGGDEFAVLVAGAGDERQALEMGEEILSLLVVPFHVHEQAIRIGASIGIACTPRDGSDLTTLLKKADIAMYNSKRTGRNKVSLFDKSLRQMLVSSVEV